MTNPTKLKEYLGEEEWENFRPTDVLSSDISGKLWNGINKNTTHPAVRYSYWRWIAVAASVLLVIGLSWQFILKEQKTSLVSAATLAKTQLVRNTTTQKMTLTLSDGSTVELLPGSTLSYAENFNSLKRDVLLSGEANFNIAKDAVRPFVVSNNAVLITVLGTRFTVKSDEADNGTKVILHEGRIMVQVAHSASKGNQHEYYLTPGDIFIFKKIIKRSPVLRAEPIPTAKGASMDSLSGVLNDSLSARILHLEKDKDDGYVFNNYPLDVVFDQLQIIYNTKIIYNKAELGNRSFIGKIDKKDPLYNILKSIALLNNFGLHKQGDSFIISN